MQLPAASISLAPGESAIIATREQVTLAGDVAAVAYPPSQLALEGLLIMGAGHIDPGYQGFVQVTVINLSKESHPLTTSMKILEVLFFQLSASARKGYRDRNPAGKEDGVALASASSRGICWTSISAPRRWPSASWIARVIAFSFGAGS